jgi:hypothetical protein
MGAPQIAAGRSKAGTGRRGLRLVGLAVMCGLVIPVSAAADFAAAGVRGSVWHPHGFAVQEVPNGEPLTQQQREAGATDNALDTTLEGSSPVTASRVLKAGFSITLTAPYSGQLSLHWVREISQFKELVLAAGAATLVAGVPSTITAHLNATGRRLVRQGRTLHLVIDAVFRLDSGTRISVATLLTVAAHRPSHRTQSQRSAIRPTKPAAAQASNAVAESLPNPVTTKKCPLLSKVAIDGEHEGKGLKYFFVASRLLSTNFGEEGPGEATKAEIEVYTTKKLPGAVMCRGVVHIVRGTKTVRTVTMHPTKSGGLVAQVAIVSPQGIAAFVSSRLAHHRRRKPILPAASTTEATSRTLSTSPPPSGVQSGVAWLLAENTPATAGTMSVCKAECFPPTSMKSGRVNQPRSKPKSIPNRGHRA